MERTNNRELKMTRTLKAPVDLVWKVWSEPEYITQWWGPNDHTTTIHEMDFTEGGVWKLTLHNHTNGRDYPNSSIFKEIIPLKKIVFEHFNPHFITTVVFEAKGEETQIEWSSLFDTEEMLKTVVHIFNAREGQVQNFERLEEYLERLKNRTEEQGNPVFDFSVNKENNTIHVKRELNASLELVWQAWTTAELLDQWFGPQPFKAETISMDFSEGGFWLYTLKSTEYGDQWGRTDYHRIEHLKYFTASDSFLDENQNLIPDYPVSSWKIEFSEKAGITTINVTTKYETLEDLEKMMEWGYMNGFTAVMQNLDELFLQLNNRKEER